MVWLPVLEGDDLDDARARAAEFPDDPRVRLFWSPDQAPGRAFRAATPGLAAAPLAWDVYLVYRRDAHWTGDLPPAPAHYQHQLGDRGGRARTLSGPELARLVENALHGH